MGMLATYMMIDEEKIAPFEKLEGEQLIEYFHSIEESEIFESIDLDKLWDALHIFCTGVTASEPIEGNRLSEAIVGTHVLSEEAFITCTELSELKAIIEAMKIFDFKNKKETFQLSQLKEEGAYPNGIWETDKDELFQILKMSFDELLAFYEKALKTNHHVMVSIM